MNSFLLLAAKAINAPAVAKKSIVLSAAALFLGALAGNTQAVSGIITDYTNFWKTSAAAPNAIKPSNSHNVLAFTFNGTQYSTGINDALLSNRGENFVAGDFWALPVAGLSSAPTSNTKVGLGEMYDGVHNGASNPAPSNTIASYLTDGIKGLNIGTCIANLPAGNIFFNVANIRPGNIGDGVPDILVTQVADPSGSLDRYSFIDANGTIVGHTKDILFSNITPVATWTADFYEASSNPLVLTSGFTNTDRPMRLWAADLSEFGITAANYRSIQRFTINLSGNSDVAFVAYNNTTFNFTHVLPVTIAAFTAKANQDKTELAWATTTELNTASFTIERSGNNEQFSAIGEIAAAGNSSRKIDYRFTDASPLAGINHYRLKTTDKDGQVKYSSIATVNFTGAAALRVFPNPATNHVYTDHPMATGREEILVNNITGVTVAKTTVARNSTRTRIQLQTLPKGVYYITWQTETEKKTQAFVIN